MKKYAIILLSLALILSLALYTTAWIYPAAESPYDKVSQKCADAINNIAHTAFTDNQDNCTVRRWYLNTITHIPTLINNKNEPLQQPALCAFNVRHQARITARTAMPDYQVAALRLRDFFSYGEFDGPTFSQLVGSREAIAARFEKIILSSQRTNKWVDDSCVI